MGQLFKIPLLVEHFAKHQEQTGVSFFDFLADHYATDHNDGDLPEDEKLPFKDFTFYSIGYATVTQVIRVHVFIPVLTGKKNIPLSSYIPQQHVARIFHPPRV